MTLENHDENIRNGEGEDECTDPPKDSMKPSFREYSSVKEQDGDLGC